jgi:hypothetical protein
MVERWPCLYLISNEMLAVQSLIKDNRAKWSGGKPSGVRGIRIKGRPLSETVPKERECSISGYQQFCKTVY